jgi:2,4-dienoyl-CoA reductase-like NADH-dependent reductase (Old Yellow Enzyme family)
LLWFEATAVVPEGRANPAQLWLHEGNVDAFRRLAAATRAAARSALGDDHEPLMILQLTHSGRYSRPTGPSRPIIAHRSPVLDPRSGIGADYPLITDGELEQLQHRYVRAAGLAAAAGFDGVDVKACHGYLVSELLAAHTRPDSRFGGPFDNRCRFLLETVQRIRADEPRLLVTSRFSAYDGIAHPYGFGTDGARLAGEDLTEPEELTRRLRATGCALLNVSIGNPYYQPHFGRPYDKPLVGLDYPDEHPLIGVARLLRIAAAVQQAVPDVPVVGTGYSWLRQHVPYVGAAMVAAGKVGLIGLGRGAFAYPDCVRDLAEHGAFDHRKTCIGCSGCSQIMRDGGQTGCIVHDQKIYAEEYRQGRRRVEERGRVREA